jgi:predicted HTH transcriptional regulator
MTETNRIEHKQEINPKLDIEKEVIAFLNYHEGGYIFIGIDKEGKVLGVKDLDGGMLSLKDRIKNNILPSCMGLFDVQAEKKDNKDIIKITIASGPEKPYFKKKYGMTEKGCFIRIGTAAEPMPQKMIDELFAKRIRNSLGKIVSNKQNLKFEQLKIYYESAGLSLNEQFASNLELLTDKDKFNYVAYLLADNNSTSIKVAKYSSKTRVDLKESNEYGNGCLIRAAKQVIDKIEIENPTSTQITSKERINKRLWDSVALREAIINAFVHNDFTNEVPPKFEIFPDRIEITSAGGLPEALSQDEFFEGFSVPRNKELMRVFKDLGMVEQLGSGVPRILESYGKECFSFSEHFLRMAFPALGGQVGGQVGGQAGGQAGGQVDGLTERQREVLDLIIEDTSISRKTLSDKLGINQSAVQKHIEALKQKGIISRESETTGYWEIHLDKKSKD